MTLTLCALTALAPNLPDLSTRAEQVDLACASVGWSAPVPCGAVLAVLWSLETADTLAWPKGGSGCGAVQVLPRGRMPTCQSLREPVIGLRSGAGLWLAKLRGAASSLRGAFRDYSGAARKERYADRAIERLRAVLGRCWRK